MIRTPMRLHEPATVEDAVALLTEFGERAAVIAGGTWLLPQMGRGERTLDHLVSLKGLGRPVIAHRDGNFVIAATATYEDVLGHRELLVAHPVIGEAFNGVTGGVGLRNVATPLGSACYANPSADAPGVLVGCEATFRVYGPQGAREIAAEEFFVGPFATCLRPGELLLEAVLPASTRRAAYAKLKTSGGGWPVATALAWIDDETHRAGVTIGAVQATPLRLDLSAHLDEHGLDGDAVLAFVGERVTDPWGDLLGDARYRRRVAGPIVRRAIDKLEVNA
jgi:aerobic carbon-monoxide dehydrogenase medium subunit